ncbi:MAG: hypothetical protein ABEJ56_04415 [Candidatus Nanohaloarchaea archaeon]
MSEKQKILIGKKNSIGLTKTIEKVSSSNFESETDVIKYLDQVHGKGEYTLTWKKFTAFRKLWQGELREVPAENRLEYRTYDTNELESLGIKQVTLPDSDWVVIEKT